MKKILLYAVSLALLPLCAAQPVPGSFEQTWEKGPQWLRNAVIYQIYPSSFQDSDGNGTGDIPGIISRLDYIKSLGVTAVWFNPMFESGWIDGGYDVKDYYKVDSRFGTNSDLVELIRECHKRGIKVMLDLVPGHTSMDHPWFLQSMQKDANQRYSDYYIWSDVLPDKKAERDLKAMLASENPLQDTRGKWMLASEIPGAERARYYMKNFYACQPSLNFGYADPDPEHPWEQGVNDPGPSAVKQEFRNILAFWYSKGVDGFRVDMANSLIKNDKDKTAIMAFWREIRSWMDENYPDRVLMAEWNAPEYCLAAGFNVDMYLNAAGSSNRQMYFDKKHQADGGVYFSLDGCRPSLRDLYGEPWPAGKVDRKVNAEDVLKKYTDSYGKALERTKDWGYFASLTGNHDHLRMNCGARNSADQLKVMMAWVLTQPLPILYYGDEIGMRSLVGLPNVEGANHNGKERAGARTPMQWDGGANAGFSSCDPERIYLPVCPEWTPANSYKEYMEWKENGCRNPVSPGMITVESQENDGNSLLNWTRALIALRKSEQAFWADSRWTPVMTEGKPYPMVYLRSDGVRTYLVALNPTSSQQSVNIAPQSGMNPGTVIAPVLSSGKTKYKTGKAHDTITMGPVSAMIVKISEAAPCNEEPSLYSKAVRHTMAHGGLDREYYVYVPDSLAAGSPFVLMLHGYGGKAYGYRPEMLETARRQGFAVCVPQGHGVKGAYKPGWNVRYPKQETMTTDDVDFVLKLADKVAEDYGLNRDNAFCCGMSNGGDLSYIIAFRHPEAFNAIASVAGLEMQWVNRSMKPSGPVPFMEVHGTADTTSAWDGDPDNKGGWGAYLSVPLAVGDLVSANACEYEEVSELALKNPAKPSRKVVLHRYLGSPYGCEVRLYEVRGGKHSWQLADMDTTGEIWDFFKKYVKNGTK